jgi:putative heme-binding domain-containing protein
MPMFPRPADLKRLLGGLLALLAAAPGLLAQPSTEHSKEPLSPTESLETFTLVDGLAAQWVLGEPAIAQPVFLSFDHRGRLWVLNYLQYPEPAGLALLSKDRFWRAVYDQVPLPPPDGVPGADKITIHEDTTGDGQFDKRTTFLEGLNIATSFAHGRGGLFVLNPPYLLFYADADQDDRPDGPPEVLLEGFGLEDTHSVVNSLRWGPDGWLYAAQGSTVSGNVRRPGSAERQFSQGQHIWRYHPETRRYEIFSEGGGNAFGVEIDSDGRIFSGHNGGNTRGFHYMQGAYLQKGFNKHGPLSNPYAFGYFPAMEHGDYARFTHTFVIYQGDRLPSPFQDRLFGVNPMNHHVVISRREVVGSTFRTSDEALAIDAADGWFRPVDIKDGPDGCLYIADWYDSQLAHTDNYQGGIDRERGRVQRLVPAAWATDPPRPWPHRPLEAHSVDSLIEHLSHPNRWHRHTALRLLRDAKLSGAAAGRWQTQLEEQLWSTAGRIDHLWGLHAVGGLSPGRAERLLSHPLEQVRLWVVRLLGDDSPSDIEPGWLRLAAQDDSIEVLCQLACTARRLPAEAAGPLLAALMRRDDHADDPRLPLLIWWALEQLWSEQPQLALVLFDDPALWQSQVVQEELLGRSMRRLATGGQQHDFDRCQQLLTKAPDGESARRLVAGFEQAFQGRSVGALPEELAARLSEHQGSSLALRLRRGDPQALQEGLRLVSDPRGDLQQRLQLVRLMGDIDLPESLPVLLDVLEQTSDEGLQAAILLSLPRYSDRSVAERLIAAYDRWPQPLRQLACSTLASRPNWGRRLLEATASGAVPAGELPRTVIDLLAMYPDRALQRLLSDQFGGLIKPDSSQRSHEQQRLVALLTAGGGSPYAGKQLYRNHCGQCHRLHAEGGQVGPDLTPFQRQDVAGLLAKILDPSRQVREGYQTHMVILEDGRLVQGFVVDRDPQLLVLRTADGIDVRLEQAQIEQHRVLERSLMPDGLLDELSDAQLLDLFAYLRSAQPLPE